MVIWNSNAHWESKKIYIKDVFFFLLLLLAFNHRVCARDEKDTSKRATMLQEEVSWENILEFDYVCLFGLTVKTGWID